MSTESIATGTAEVFRRTLRSRIAAASTTAGTTVKKACAWPIAKALGLLSDAQVAMLARWSQNVIKQAARSKSLLRLGDLTAATLLATDPVQLRSAGRLARRVIHDFPIGVLRRVKRVTSWSLRKLHCGFAAAVVDSTAAWMADKDESARAWTFTKIGQPLINRVTKISQTLSGSIISLAADNAAWALITTQFGLNPVLGVVFFGGRFVKQAWRLIQMGREVKARRGDLASWWKIYTTSMVEQLSDQYDAQQDAKLDDLIHAFDEKWGDTYPVVDLGEQTSLFDEALFDEPVAPNGDTMVKPAPPKAKKRNRPSAAQRRRNNDKVVFSTETPHTV